MVLIQAAVNLHIQLQPRHFNWRPLQTFQTLITRTMKKKEKKKKKKKKKKIGDAADAADANSTLDWTNTAAINGPMISLADVVECKSSETEAKNKGTNRADSSIHPSIHLSIETHQSNIVQ